jgi:integrase
MNIDEFRLFIGDRKKGTWSVDFTYIDERGTSRRRKVTTGTTDRRIAEKIAPELIANYRPRSRNKNTKLPPQLQEALPDLPKPSASTRLRHVQRYFIALYDGAFEKKTLGLLQSSFNSLINHVGNKSIGEIDSLDIQKWHSGFLKERTRDLGKHVSTTRGLSAYHRMLQARFNDLVKARILLANPLKGLKPKDLKRDVQGRAWTQLEIDRILSIADEMTKPKDRRKRSTVLPLLPHFIRIGLSTGLRTDELCDLRWDQILEDPADGKKKIIFWENDTKTDIAGKVTLSRRANKLLDEINLYYDGLVISSDLRNPDEGTHPFAFNALSHFPDVEPMEAIRLYCIRLYGLPQGQNVFNRLNTRPGLTYVFEHGNGRKWSTTNVAHNFKKVIGQAGLQAQGPKRFSPYETRHTFAVHAIKRGLPLSELQSTLRHQDINLTALYATTDRVDMIEMDI